MESGTALAERTVLVDEGPWESVRASDDGVLVDEVVELHRRIARLQAACAARISEIDRRGLPLREGFGSTPGWLIAHSGDPAGICRSRVRSARGLRHMPHTREAFTDGVLSEPRVRMLVDARDTEPSVFQRDENLLVSQARRLTPADFRQALAYWRRLADSDGHLRDLDRAYRRRRLHASVTWQGVVQIDGQLDPEGGATLITALRSLTDPTNLDPSDTRTPAQRRADAIVELARRHLDNPNRP